MKPYVVLIRLILIICCFLSISPATTAQSISGVVNSYYRVTGINVVPNTVTVTSSAGLSPGMKILIIQMKGAAINSANSNLFGNINAVNNAGNYEINVVCGVAGNNILLKYSLTRSYDATGSVQLITVPQYNSVTVVDTVRAANWSAATGTGGVVVLEASNTIYLNSAIDVSGKGFVGGSLQNYPDCVWSTDVTQYALPISSADVNVNGSRKGEGIADFIVGSEFGRGKQANGGGGGNNHNTGGAGGSNYGTGGNGGIRSNETFFQCHGTSAGVGGLTLSPYGYSGGANNKIFFGGGGGSGHQNNNVATPGGNGGGIIILIANTIYNGTGKLMANGGLPYNPLCVNPYSAEGDGGGGGGAGGTIVLNVQNIANGTLTTEAIGAAGSQSGRATNNCTGPGGGGGGGVVWVSNAAVLPNISSVVNGGINGTISMVNSTVACRGLANGATSGGNGTNLSGHVLPLSAPLICSPLAADNILYFEGKSGSIANQLSWSVSSIDEIVQYQVERSDNQVSYQVIYTIINNGVKSQNVFDQNPPYGTSYYRLKIKYKNGQTDYSKLVAIDRKLTSGFDWISLNPNPATDQFKINLTSVQQGNLQISVINQLGQQQRSYDKFITKGYNTITLPVETLSPGIYFIVLNLNGNRQVKKVIVNAQIR